MSLNTFRRSVIFMSAILAATGRLLSSAAESNSVPRDEVVFSRANPAMIWGDKTNFVTGDPFSSNGTNLVPLAVTLRAGVNVKNGVIVLSGEPLRVLDPADINIFTDSTQVWLGVPPFNESVSVFMSDSNNLPVPQTPKGLAVGQPLMLEPGTTWFHWSLNNRNPWFRVFDTASYELMTIKTVEVRWTPSAGPKSAEIKL